MKKILILLSVVVLVLICVIGYLKYKDYTIGNIDEREELLIETTYDLFQEKNIDLKDVSKIQVTRLDAGVYPFFYSVTVDLKNGESYEYGWKTKEKDELEITHHTP